MNLKRHLAETATLVAAAVLCALVSNTLAGRERKLAVPGRYENALRVPSDGTAPSVPPAGTEAAPPATVAEAAAPPDGSAPPSAVSAAPSAASAAPPSRSAAATSSAGPVTTSPARSAGPASAPKAADASDGADLLARFPPHKDKPYVEIHGDDAAFLHGKKALFLDARRTNVYEEGHIAGARPYSVWESDVDQKVVALVGEARDPAQPVVIYCSGGDCEDSHMLAQKLWGAGFENLLVYKDGFPDWQKRGHAIRTGSEP